MTPAFGRTLFLALALAAARPAAADDLGDFAAAIERTAAQYHFALRTLDTSGREQTATEVRLLRQEWQGLIARLDNRRAAGFDGDNADAATMMDIDMRLVTALIVIDIGSREAARAALAPIGETLAKLREQADKRQP